MNRSKSGRVSFFRNTTDPSAVAPCSWNTFFARSTPMMVTFNMDVLSFDLSFNNASLAQCAAARGERHPPHLCS
jgi:hypothetical protein